MKSGGAQVRNQSIGREKDRTIPSRDPTPQPFMLAHPDTPNWRSEPSPLEHIVSRSGIPEKQQSLQLGKPALKGPPSPVSLSRPQVRPAPLAAWRSPRRLTPHLRSELSALKAKAGSPALSSSRPKTFPNVGCRRPRAGRPQRPAPAVQATSTEGPEAELCPGFQVGPGPRRPAASPAGAKLNPRAPTPRRGLRAWATRGRGRGRAVAAAP